MVEIDRDKTEEERRDFEIQINEEQLLNEIITVTISVGTTLAINKLIEK